MPDSMNYTNDPSAMPPQNPMQGWDPAYMAQMQELDPALVAQMQDPAYMQAMYGQDPMAVQAMYGNQMPQQGYSGYADPMTQQAMYGGDSSAYQQSGYYQDPSYMQQGYESPDQQPVMDFGMQQTQGMSIPMQNTVGPQQQTPQSSQPMGPILVAPEQQQPAQVAQAASQPHPMSQPTLLMQAPTNSKPPSKGQATASLIMGIFSIIFAVIPPIGVILGWLSSRLAKKYIKAGGNSAAADSGKIFGKVGYFFSWFMFIVLVFLIAYVAGASFGNYGARAVTIFYNNSPLGKLFGILPL